MQDAVAQFLRAAGLQPEANPALAQTPALVAEAWANDLLEGYRDSPEQVLEERMPVARGARPGLVVLENIAFQSVCPHHLLPYAGVAHVGYVPGRWTVGFGQIVRLVDCLSRRLVLQEDLAEALADAMSERLGARAVAVVLEAEQACVALRGTRRHGARAVAEAFRGDYARSAEERLGFRARWGVRRS